MTPVPASRKRRDWSEAEAWGRGFQNEGCPLGGGIPRGPKPPARIAFLLGPESQV